jgi:hypothetical protein
LRAGFTIVHIEANPSPTRTQSFSPISPIVRAIQFSTTRSRHLGIARGYVLAGDAARSRAAYLECFVLWKDADPEIPVLKQAKAEFAKLQKSTGAIRRKPGDRRDVPQFRGNQTNL